MNPSVTWIVADHEAGERIDKFLTARVQASRAALRRLLEQGAVRVDGHRAKKGERLMAGAQVVMSETPPAQEELRPRADTDGPLEVVYEDADLIGLAKPPGIFSHPLRPGETGTLANRLVARYPECVSASADPREGGLCHRLDAGTSGILLAARSAPSWQAVRERFSAGQVTKEYLALVSGSPTLPNGTITAPLAQRGRRSVVDAAGQAAETHWAVQESFRDEDWTLLRITTRSGRMHQVRAHLGYAALPIVGDDLYGGPPCEELVGHFLHAERLSLPHLRTEELLTLVAPLPSDRLGILAKLRAPT